jgi:hypothetical protein
MTDQIDLAVLALLPDTVKRQILGNVHTIDPNLSLQQPVEHQPSKLDQQAAAVAEEVVSAVRSRAVRLPTFTPSGSCVVDNVLTLQEAQVMPLPPLLQLLILLCPCCVCTNVFGRSLT